MIVKVQQSPYTPDGVTKVLICNRDHSLHFEIKGEEAVNLVREKLRTRKRVYYEADLKQEQGELILLSEVEEQTW